MHSRHDFTIYIFERHVRALHIYVRHKNFVNFLSPEISDFRFFFSVAIFSCEGIGFDGGYNSEVETAGVNITIPSTNHQQLLHSQSYYETFYVI